MRKLINVRNWLLKKLAGETTVILNLNAMGPLNIIGELKNNSFFNNVNITMDPEDKDILVENSEMASNEFKNLVSGAKPVKQNI